MLRDIFLTTLEKYSSDKEYNLSCWDELLQLYSNPDRHYHNMNHIEDMVHALDEVKHLIMDYDAVLFAIFYHDAVYDVARSDNEAASADLLEQRLQGTSFDWIETCKTLILATKSHCSTDDNDSAYFLDIDLSVLGKEWEQYNEYAQAIRNEYRLMEEKEYAAGRVTVLNRFLTGDCIYKTAFFSDKYEQQAIQNVSREITSLRDRIA